VETDVADLSYTQKKYKSYIDGGGPEGKKDSGQGVDRRDQVGHILIRPTREDQFTGKRLGS